MKKRILLPAGFLFVILSYGQDHFSTSWTGNGVDHMNIYVSFAAIDDIPLDAGDEIGVFDEDICVGAGICETRLDNGNYLSIIMSRDDSETIEKDGFTPGNTLIFKLWDKSENIELEEVLINHISGSDQFIVGSTSIVGIYGYNLTETNLSFINGWNIFSLTGLPLNPDMNDLFLGMIADSTLVKIQDEKGNTLEYLGFLGRWENNIGGLSTTEGYKIRVSKDTSFTIIGRPVQLPFKIPLKEGWNIIGFPLPDSVSSEAILADLILAGSLQKVQDEQGQPIEYLDFLERWEYGFDMFTPGKGYKMRMNRADTMIIRSAYKKATYNDVRTNNTSHFKKSWSGNGVDHMNIYVRHLNYLKPGDEIGIFDKGVCVGAAVVADQDYVSIPVSMDDPVTKIADGYIEDNDIELRIWYRAENREVIVESVNPENDLQAKFQKHETIVLCIDAEYISINLESKIDENDKCLTIYPNPFHNYLHIKVMSQINQLSFIKVIDITGRTVYTQPYHLRKGENLILWNGKTGADNEIFPGLYYISFSTKGNNQKDAIPVLKNK